MANKISEFEEEIDEVAGIQPLTKYNGVVLTVFRIDAYKKIMRNCEVELFEVKKSIESLEFEKTLLVERKKEIENKLEKLEKLLAKYQENDDD